MIRICTSLATQGYNVTLVGRKLPTSIPLPSRNFRQKRINCFNTKGVLFYAEYNIRLFFWLLFQKTDCICAIDLDTILPCLFASTIKKTKRVYDAHELFCEMKEVVTRPSRYKAWKRIEKFAVPKFKYGYTVCEPIAGEFKKMYGVKYEVVRNVPIKTFTDERWPMAGSPTSANNQPSANNEIFFLYQGAVNEGRSFETLIPAMKEVDAALYIYGDGNFFQQTKELINEKGLQHKIFLKGKLQPDDLKQITPSAYAGITLFENNGLSNYYSFANRFFDYIQAGIPQVCIDFPAYRQINEVHHIAVLIPDNSPKSISAGMNLLLNDVVLYKKLKANCIKAAETLNWQEEEKLIIRFYNKVFG